MFSPSKLFRSFAVACLLFAAAAFSHAASAKPNILIILADDMGFSDAGCYGGEVQTPNLDALAKDGLRFTQFYNTARCWPSRGALLTGYYAQEIRRDTVPGVLSGGRGIRPGWAKLLPEMLKTQGYRTYHSGKWHVDGKPLQNGFDHSYDIEDHNRNFNPTLIFEDDQKLPPVKPDSGYYTSTAYADHAIKCLKEHAEKYSDQPFFEYLAFTVPHFPLQAPAQDIAKYRDRFRKGWDEMRVERWQRLKDMGIVDCALSPIERSLGPPYAFPKDVALLGPGEVDRPVPWDTLTDVQKDFQATKMAIHAAMVDRMDQEIGRVLAQIKTMGQYENTIILFLSDNGASAEMMVRGDGHDPSAPMGSAKTFLCLGPGFSSLANTPFRRHKTWTHEGGIATPFIVHWSKGIATHGELRHTPSHLVDVVPTLMELAGGKPFDTWEGQPVPPRPGKSLVPALAKDVTIPRQSIWWQHEGNRALRMGDWKIVASGEKSPWELYDLSKDRGEQNDLASSQPEKLKELVAEWEKETGEYRALALKDATPEMKAKGAPKKKEAD
ncbi:sulfatase [Chthoniobacter flavus Ellin428]|uniref:Sulfatase n=1 Tax=Chthoniobacter flavus Ellin428 TaxID=497964 RepID=B4D601_9BACT|nr:arylsulfatase [Chthoniobacter flavus]EDY18204.1 sulfatase [Chthoniobacter flavus Ellin428]TCO91444.1 arylsulfatase [Chthoniobacter flavus]